jgi:hypothetical protein
MDHRLDRRDGRMLCQRRKARVDHRPTRQGAVLLRPAAASAQPATSCNDDGRDSSCHIRTTPEF